MFLNNAKFSTCGLWCFAIVLLLRNVVSVSSASIQIQNNFKLEKKTNLNCLQMDTWDCFNINKGYFQSANKNKTEQKNGEENNRILLKATPSGNIEIDDRENDRGQHVNKTPKYDNVGSPYFFSKTVKHIQPKTTAKNKDLTTIYNLTSLGQPRSTRTSRTLGHPNDEEEETDDIETRTKKTVNEVRELDLTDSFLSSSFRTARISRKMWMAILAGIVLKFASLLPLILGKFALLGTVSIIASKMSLLIVAIMALRQMFTADIKGFGTFPDLGLGGQHQPLGHQPLGHQPQYLGHHVAQYQQAMTQHQQTIPQQVYHHGYHPMMALSYANTYQAAPAASRKKWKV